MEIGIPASCQAMLTWPPPTIPSRIVNRTITNTSSTDDAARINVGMPFLAPFPLSIKSIISGTTTAGDTAPRMAPSKAASINDIFSRRGAMYITAPISNNAGTTDMISAGLPTRFKVSRRSSNPARRRIMIKAILRKSAETVISSAFNSPRVKGPTSIPMRSMPTRPGSLILLNNMSAERPRRTIKAILTAMDYLTEDGNFLISFRSSREPEAISSP